jgi:predicted O-methyltransferase YrrM
VNAQSRNFFRSRFKLLLFKAHRFASRFGIHVLPVHYYSTVPDLLELERTRSIWAKRSDMPGINVTVNEQVESLRAICSPYAAECVGNSPYFRAIAEGYGLGYGYIEAQVLHCVLRYLKPAQVIEVGGGVSSYCIATALKLNEADTAREAKIVTIEPYPRPALKKFDAVNLIQNPVQEVSADLFTTLRENDFLFIDSSHTVKPGSDVNYLVLEIMPRLRPGVVVHFHDIYFPYDYSVDTLNTFFHWNETSLLRAFLIHNRHAKILFSLSQLHYDAPRVLTVLFPEYMAEELPDGLRVPRRGSGQSFPSSTYILIE